MRDDAEALLGDLLSCLTQKETLLKNMLRSDRDKVFNIKLKKLEEVNSALAMDEHFMAEIDVLDFSASRAIDTFSEIAGIDRNEFFPYISSLDEEVAGEIASTRGRIETLLEKLNRTRKEFNRRLADSMGETSSDLRELKTILRFKYPDADKD